MSKGRTIQAGTVQDFGAAIAASNAELGPVVVATAAEPTIFARSSAGRRASNFTVAGGESDAVSLRDREPVPAHLARSTAPALPEVTEPELVRHYTRLSQRNHCIDTGFYPLGSCTMKYNPKVHEDIVSMPGFSRLHPLQESADSQGTLEVLWNLQHALGELSGLPGVSLQPAAGAHGEFTGLLIMRAWHQHRIKQGLRTDLPRHVLIPDTAHGTNPASVTMAGFEAVSVRTNSDGGMDVDEVRRLCNELDVVGLMLTNPTTLGLFDSNIAEIAELVHRAQGLVYYDGANLNAIMGICRPGDMGFDIVHINTHKTFSTPHGGGGPGAGPVAVRDYLAPFLPAPWVTRTESGFELDFGDDKSIGRVKSFWGNVGVLVRAWAYIRTHGPDGLRRASELAVLNANYVLARIRDAYELPYGDRCMHEFVISASELKRKHGVRALDVAKRLIDFGFHPPTVYFPLLVEEALMVEPTETESRETLDLFAEAMLKCAREAARHPERLLEAPHDSPVRRLDEAQAARQPVLRDPHVELLPPVAIA